MIRYNHHTICIPHTHIQLFQNRSDTSWPSRVMHHGEIYLARDDITRTNRIEAGSARDDFFRQRGR